MVHIEFVVLFDVHACLNGEQGLLVFLCFEVDRVSVAVKACFCFVSHPLLLQWTSRVVTSSFCSVCIRHDRSFWRLTVASAEHVHVHCRQSLCAGERCAVHAVKFATETF